MLRCQYFQLSDPLQDLPQCLFLIECYQKNPGTRQRKLSTVCIHDLISGAVCGPEWSHEIVYVFNPGGVSQGKKASDENIYLETSFRIGTLWSRSEARPGWGADKLAHGLQLLNYERIFDAHGFIPYQRVNKSIKLVKAVTTHQKTWCSITRWSEEVVIFHSQHRKCFF